MDIVCVICWQIHNADSLRLVARKTTREAYRELFGGAFNSGLLDSKPQFMRDVIDTVDSNRFFCSNSYIKETLVVNIGLLARLEPAIFGESLLGRCFVVVMKYLKIFSPRTLGIPKTLSEFLAY